MIAARQSGFGVVFKVIEFRVWGVGLRLEIFRIESLKQGRWGQSQVVFVVLIVGPDVWLYLAAHGCFFALLTTVVLSIL